MKRYLLVATLLGLLTACQQPQIKGAPNARGLSEVAGSGMDAAQVDPNTDFSRYRSIAIADINFSRLQVVEPSDYSGRYDRFKLSEDDMARVRAEYRRKLGEVLSEKGRFEIVDRIVPGSTSTLVIHTDMVRLEPNAPREKDEIGIGSARDKTFTQGAGSMTLEAVLIDAGTGKAVLVLRDEVSDIETWGENNALTNRAAILRAFTSWGYAIRRQLDAFSRPAQ